MCMHTYIYYITLYTLLYDAVVSSCYIYMYIYIYIFNHRIEIADHRSTHARRLPPPPASARMQRSLHFVCHKLHVVAALAKAGREALAKPGAISPTGPHTRVQHLDFRKIRFWISGKSTIC